MTRDNDLTLFNLPNLPDRDFSEQNAETTVLWKAFWSGAHERVPVRLNTNPRILMLDPAYNTRGVTYDAYMHDPEIMAQAILEWQYWFRHLLPGDHDHGLPEKWLVHVDFENHYDAAWFGCPVHYREGQVPDTTPILNDDNKRMLFDRGIPDPFIGEWPERCLRYLETFGKKQQQGWSFLGRPVEAVPGGPFLSCDGILTVAVSLRGATALFLDLLTDPDYVHELLEFVFAALSTRMRAWRERTAVPIPQEGFWHADDAIEMISCEQYQEFVLPWHRRMYDTFAKAEGRSIHLCGDAQRHFTTIHRELGVNAFDTGFPVDFGRLRRELGPDVLVSGGPAVPFFIEDSAEPILAETERILQSGILAGGRFILQEGNNLAPCARLDVCRQFYEAGKRLGRRALWNAPQS